MENNNENSQDWLAKLLVYITQVFQLYEGDPKDENGKSLYNDRGTIIHSEDVKAIINNKRAITIYLNKRNYTYKGIYRALYYFYTIKGMSTEKANKRIGIVPYVYDEAKDYFAKKNYEEQKIASQPAIEKTQIVVKPTVKQRKVETIDINAIE